MEKTSSITFRLNQKILERIKKEANHNRTSVNTLAGQVFQDYVDYNALAAKAGMVSFPKTLLIRLMDNLSDKEFEKTATWIMENEMKDVILLLTDNYDTNSILDMVESWVRISGFAYRHDYDSHGKHKFLIQHNMGTRWSLFLEKLFRYTFEDVQQQDVEFNITKDVISFSVDTSSVFEK